MFFRLKLYIFFGTTHKPAILMSHFKPNAKIIISLSVTRWSYRHGIRVEREALNDITQALNTM